MTLPGFSAETSLYKTGIHYCLMDGSVQAGGIMLQQFGPAPVNSCFWRCHLQCRWNPWYQACYSACVLDNCM